MVEKYPEVSGLEQVDEYFYLELDMQRFESNFKLLSLALCWASIVAQMNGKGFVLKDDLPHIACDMCKLVVDSLYHSVEDMREVAPYKKVWYGRVRHYLILYTCTFHSDHGVGRF